MSDYDAFCQKMTQARDAIADGFAALARAVQPVFNLMSAFVNRTCANRRSRRAFLEGNVAKLNWYMSERIRRMNRNICGSSERMETKD